MRKRALIGAGIFILLLLAIAGWAYLDWSRYRAAQAEGARSQQVLDSTETLLAHLLDAETAQRGYLLTGDDRYLDPYRQANQTVPADLAQLESLMGRDSAAQTANARQLRSLVGQKMSELSQTVELRRTQGASAALDVVLSDRGRSLMDAIRAIVVSIQNGERSSAANISVSAQAATTILLMAAVAGSLILLFYFVAALDPVLHGGHRQTKHPRLMAYGVAVAATGVALFLAAGLSSVISPLEAPFLTFLPAVLFASWYAGVRSGASTLFLLAAGFSAWHLFSPAELPRADRQSFAIGVLFFMLVGAGIVFLAHSQRRALQRADQEARQRREAEEAERKQRREFETTLSSIGDAVVSTDAEGQIRYVNDAARKILRYPDSQLMGRPLDEVFRIFHESTRQPVESPVTKVLREGSVVGLANHTVLIAGDGAEIPLDDSGAPVRSMDGTINGVVLVFRDVTERRAAERLLEQQSDGLRASESLFRTLANALPQLIWMAQEDGFVFWYNDRWYDYTGAPQSESEGWGWQSVYDPTMLPAILEMWHRAIATGTPLEVVLPLRGKSGVFSPFLTKVIPLRDSEGKIVRWVGTHTDISEQRRVEEGLRESEARLERLNADLARSNADLQQFAFVASHDLREPLRMITSYAQLLARKYPTETDGEAALMVGNIVSGTSRMGALISDLLKFVEIGYSQEPKDQTADLDAVVEHVKENLKDAIAESGASIECDPLPVLRADGTYLTPLFQNLASNAIKYRNHNPPRIRIRFEQADGELRFAVSDNGIGIDPAHHRKIFDVFQRLHGRDVPGTGLGLAICKRVVERYRGRIWVESVPGAGSTFYFTLPEAQAVVGQG